jgi:HlyD family secretion protein
MKKSLLLLPASLACAGLAAWGGVRLYQRTLGTQDAASIPTTKVRRGDVTFTVAARGELQGGNSEMLIAPMTGGNDMHLTSLRQNGELVKPGEVVASFDTTEPEFRLKEAESDLAEAGQQVAQAEAEAKAKEEENRLLLVQARSEVKLAELEVRRNEMVAAIVARQNNLALEAAMAKLRQLEHDIPNRKATSEAAIRIQAAALNKAKVLAETARRNIDAMTLRVKSGGYVALQRNMDTDFFMQGMQFPLLQVGDRVRAGMGVAQIPDLSNWEVLSRIGELDRGHLAVGQPVEIEVVALPGRKFHGRIKNIGGTTGPPWNRNFECKLSLEDAAAELRPGMSAKVNITTELMKNALWLPAQALFESDGRAFVYRETGSSFVPADVKLVRRSDTQVVVTGVNEGQLVAMASPDQQSGKKGAKSNAMQAIQK